MKYLRVLHSELCARNASAASSVKQSWNSVKYLLIPGKTFVYKSLMHILRGQGKTALACAPTGIASTLLPGGRTSHSLFKLPVPFNETSVSSIKLGSPQAKLLKDASLIVWVKRPCHRVSISQKWVVCSEKLWERRISPLAEKPCFWGVISCKSCQWCQELPDPPSSTPPSSGIRSGRP